MHMLLANDTAADDFHDWPERWRRG